LLVLEEELAVLAKLDSENTTVLIRERDRVWCDHTHLGLLGYCAFRRWLLLGLLVLFRWVGIFVVGALVDHA